MKRAVPSPTENPQPKMHPVPTGKITRSNGTQPNSPESDLRIKNCSNGVCKESLPKMVDPEPHPKLCKGESCEKCPPGQSPGKNNSCVSTAIAKNGAVPQKAVSDPLACPAGQVWNGAQCMPATPPCMPNETMVGGSCQPNCTIPTAGAQNLIMELRSARQKKDDVCRQNPNTLECLQAESSYDLSLNEYRNFLGGVPSGCTLPDPISI
jgi:hypothetical protein